MPLDSISISASINLPGGDASPGFGAALFVVTDDTPFENTRSYVGLSGGRGRVVTDDFPDENAPGQGADVYRAAVAYFSQDPHPARPFIVGRWNKGIAASILVSGNIATANRTSVGALTDPGTLTLTTGEFLPADRTAVGGVTGTAETLIFGSVTVTLTALLGLTGTPTLSDIATALATDINANSAFTGVTVAVTGTRLAITEGSAGDFLGTTYALPTGTGAAKLQLTSGDDPYWTTDSTQFSIGGERIALVNTVLLGANPALTAIDDALADDINLNPNFSGITVEAAATRLTVTRPTTGATGTLTYPTGTVAALLHLDSNGATSFEPGSDEVETFGDFISEVNSSDSSWYWLILANDVADTASDRSSVRDWMSTTGVTSRKHWLLDVTENTWLTSTGVTTQLASQLGEGTLADDFSQRVSLIWSGTRDYKSASVAGLFASIDFDGEDTLLTAKYKRLPGRTIDGIGVLNANAVAALDGARVNYYSSFAGSGGFSEGTTLRANVYIDRVYWMDWFINDIRTALNETLATERRIPLDTRGIAHIENVVRAVCRRGVRNGGIREGGAISASTLQSINRETGERRTDPTLLNGYDVYIEPIQDTNRVNGSLPTIHVWVSGTAAIHALDLDIALEQ